MKKLVSGLLLAVVLMTVLKTLPLWTKIGQQSLGDLEGVFGDFPDGWVAATGWEVDNEEFATTQGGFLYHIPVDEPVRQVTWQFIEDPLDPGVADRFSIEDASFTLQFASFFDPEGRTGTDTDEGGDRGMSFIELDYAGDESLWFWMRIELHGWNSNADPDGPWADLYLNGWNGFVNHQMNWDPWGDHRWWRIGHSASEELFFIETSPACGTWTRRLIMDISEDPQTALNDLRFAFSSQIGSNFGTIRTPLEGLDPAFFGPLNYKGKQRDLPLYTRIDPIQMAGGVLRTLPLTTEIHPLPSGG